MQTYKKENYEKWKESIKKAQDKYNKKYFQETGITPTKRTLNYKHKRVEELRKEGCTNAWMVINRGCEPKYKEVK